MSPAPYIVAFAAFEFFLLKQQFFIRISILYYYIVNVISHFVGYKYIIADLSATSFFYFNLTWVILQYGIVGLRHSIVDLNNLPPCPQLYSPVLPNFPVTKPELLKNHIDTFVSK